MHHVFLFGCKPLLIEASLFNRSIPGHTFEQQLFNRLHASSRQRPVHKDVAIKCVADRGHGHAVVMRHIIADNAEAPPLNYPAWRIVDRVMETVEADGAEFLQMPHVLHGGTGPAAQCQGAGIGGNYQVIGQATAQPEPGNAKGTILVVACRIRGGECRFRSRE